MSRDELRQPLRKRSLKERLWAKRPSPLLSASLLAASGFIAFSAWAIHTPLPFAGEPIVYRRHSSRRGIENRLHHRSRR